MRFLPPPRLLLQPPPTHAIACVQGAYVGCFQATVATGERLFCVDIPFRISLWGEPAGDSEGTMHSLQ